MKGSAHQKIPKSVLSVIGSPEPGTRVYKAAGTQEDLGRWMEGLVRVGPVVPSGAVSMFAPVSRAAVHKRIKEGRLTAFTFHVRPAKEAQYAWQKVPRERPFVFVPVSECRAWGDELKLKGRGFPGNQPAPAARPLATQRPAPPRGRKQQ